MDAFDIFKTAPREVTRYFDAKENRPTFDWRDIAPEEHAYSWTIAKSAGYDILDDMKAAMSDAIANRTPLDEFQRNVTGTLQAKGWWGKKLDADPDTGELKVVQLGSPRRLRTIYWANTRTAHAAGEWERTERNEAFLPFLLYVRSTAENKRLEHLDWVGIVAPVGDPIWDKLYPPNGWGCQCRVRQISRREAIALGWKDDAGPVYLPERAWKNKRTGETRTVPIGIDPGWDTNPGKLRSQNVSRFLHDKIEAMPAARQAIAMEDIVQSPVLRAMVDGRMPKAWMPVAQLPQSVVDAFAAKTAVARLSSDSIHHILEEHAERKLGVDDFRSALAVITSPVAAIRSKTGHAINLIGNANGSWWRLIVKSAAQGKEWWIQSLHRKSEGEALKVVERARRAETIVE